MEEKESPGSVSLIRGQFSGYYYWCIERYYSETTPLRVQELPYMDLAADAEIKASAAAWRLLADSFLSPGHVTGGLGGVWRSYGQRVSLWRCRRTASQLRFFSNPRSLQSKLYEAWSLRHISLRCFCHDLSLVFLDRVGVANNRLGIRYKRTELWLENTVGSVIFSDRGILS